MDDVRFVDVMQRERDLLQREREDIVNQQQELERNLAGINRELEAVDAYELTKTGKVVGRTRRTVGSRAQHVPRGSRREALIEVIRADPNGLSRGEILERMGLKGDKSGEMSVSNALTSMTKSNQVARREGKYIATA